VTVQSNSASSFWVVTDGDFANAVRLPLDTGRVEGMALAPDGRIFYRSSAAGRQTIFVVGQDARANRLPFDSPGDAEIAVSPDGRYMVFSSNREGKLNLWRADADGGNLLRLTDGEGELRPCFTPDGRWIVYQKGFGNVATSFWKVSVDGGPSEQVSDLRIKTPSVSPDGRMIAGFFMDSSEQERPWRIGVISLESGLMLRKFDVPSTIFSHRIRWTPDGKALAYIHGGGDVSNIMVQPLDGSPPKQFTDFKADQVIDFAWAQDSRRFVCARAAESSYVALILDR
jgi:Tol biopolymer transport system component